MTRRAIKCVAGYHGDVGLRCRHRLSAAAHNNLFAAAMDSITEDELYEHVEVLADDVYEGRGGRQPRRTCGGPVYARSD